MGFKEPIARSRGGPGELKAELKAEGRSQIERSAGSVGVDAKFNSRVRDRDRERLRGSGTEAGHVRRVTCDGVAT